MKFVARVNVKGVDRYGLNNDIRTIAFELEANNEIEAKGIALEQASQHFNTKSGNTEWIEGLVSVHQVDAQLRPFNVYFVTTPPDQEWCDEAESRSNCYKILAIDSKEAEEIAKRTIQSYKFSDVLGINIDRVESDGQYDSEES